MRFIHTSDWQLGKPFGRAPVEARAALQEARLDVIDSIAAAARRAGVAFVLVAGDVFDSAEPGDRVYRQALSRMKAAAPLRWYLLPGNHDPARADGLWSRLAAEASDNVIPCLAPKALEIAEQLWLLPAPLDYKRNLQDPTAWFDAAVTPPGAVRIGLAHGTIQSFAAETADVANLIAPNRAALAGLRYLALGDWHGRREINAATHYSGTPEPDDFGREVSGVALLVDPSGPAPAITKAEVGRYRWVEAHWTLSDASHMQSLLDELAPGVDRKDLVVRLKISGVLSLTDRVAVRERLESELAHDVRWLDLQMHDLFARPTDHDLADIDANGVLRDAAEHLLALSAEGGAEAGRASSALERLYVEHQRAQRIPEGS